MEAFKFILVAVFINIYWVLSVVLGFLLVVIVIVPVMIYDWLSGNKKKRDALPWYLKR